MEWDRWVTQKKNAKKSRKNSAGESRRDPILAPLCLLLLTDRLAIAVLRGESVPRAGGVENVFCCCKCAQLASEV
jgi:hypothetical protein